ncbi:MAG: TetR family transcriptional regulator [Bacteroidota bacterium]
MKTKHLVKQTARVCFNEKGLMNVTLRDVAAQLDKSYGNITYHYPTKEAVITELFDDMNAELAALQKPPQMDQLLAYFLFLPKVSFDITLKYLFFTIDHNEIKRNYPDFFARVKKLNDQRKVKWYGLLKFIYDEGFLRNDLVAEDLNYLMFLSASVRTMYFQFNEPAHYKKSQYTKSVNLLLKPYLSVKGLEVYRQCLVD